MKSCLFIILATLLFNVSSSAQVNFIAISNSCSGYYGEGFNKDISFNPSTTDLCFVSVSSGITTVIYSIDNGLSWTNSGLGNIPIDSAYNPFVVMSDVTSGGQSLVVITSKKDSANGISTAFDFECNQVPSGFSTYGPYEKNYPSIQTQYDFNLLSEMEALNNGKVIAYGLMENQSASMYVDTVLLLPAPLSSWYWSFNYDLKAPFPVSNNNSGNKMVDQCRLSFAADNLTGYLYILGNNHAFGSGDTSAYYPIIKKTIDGGVTWGPPISLNLSSLNTFFAGSGLNFNARHELDGAVDANGNLHLFTLVGKANGEEVSGQNGKYGLFEISTADGGSTWNACLIDKPKAFKKSFYPWYQKTNYHDLRVLKDLSRSKIFFTWIDTDTLTFGANDNSFPDIHYMGLNVNSMAYTTVNNLTFLTDADGNCLNYNAAPYVEDAGTAGFGLKATVSEYDTVCHITHYYVDGILSGTFNGPAPVCVPLAVVTHNDIVQSPEIKITYNAITGMINLDCDCKDYTSCLYDLSGRKIVMSHKAQMNVQNIPGGIYIYSLDGDNVNFKQKIMITN
jgi:hypothetical protein